MMKNRKVKMLPILIVSNEYDISYARGKNARDAIIEILYALLQLIPQGYVTTYKELGSILGISPRYVGRLLSLNTSPIAVPCHRVVKSDGGVGGYTINKRKSSEFKIKLLSLEGVKIRQDKVAKNMILSLKELIN